MHATARYFSVWGLRTTSNGVSTAAVFLDIEKSSDTAWHPGLSYELSKWHFPAAIIHLISSFLSSRTFRVTVEGEMFTSREIQAGEPQDFVLAPTLYTSYINDTPETPAFFADDTCIYATDHKEGYVFRHMQCGLTPMQSWCERQNIKSTRIRLKPLFPPSTKAGQEGSSYIEGTERTLRKSCKIQVQVF